MEKIYRSYCTILEMLKDRGYEIPDDSSLSYEDFVDWLGEDFEEAKEHMTQTFWKGENPTSGLTVFWVNNLGTGDVKMIYETIKEDELCSAIAVHITKITPSAIPVLKSLRQLKPAYNIEPFLVSELQINITKHVDVPRHIICGDKKKKEVLEKYGISKAQLPRILLSDPMCRYLGAKKGQLIKIIRVSESIPSIMTKNGDKELYDVSYRIVF